ncbi:MAG: response regulator [Armatimonadota bacterium]
MSTRILLADDHAILREGLRSLLEGEEDMEVIAEAADGRTAVRLARKLSPDVVLMDVSMPDLNGIDATRQIVTDAPNVKVIALSMHADWSFASDILRAGALGYVVKSNAFAELAMAVRAVVEGKAHLSPGIARLAIERFVRNESGASASAISALSGREREVLQLLAEGRTGKGIAERLHISESTAASHRRSIMEKLGTRNIPELVKLAIREGLTPLES